MSQFDTAISPISGPSMPGQNPLFPQSPVLPAQAGGFDGLTGTMGMFGGQMLLGTAMQMIPLFIMMRMFQGAAGSVPGAQPTAPVAQLAPASAAQAGPYPVAQPVVQAGSKTMGVLSKFMKWGGRALGVAGGGYMMYDGYTRGGIIGVGEATLGGAIAGASIGSAFPGPGTIIGGIIGGIAGFITGMVGKSTVDSEQESKLTDLQGQFNEKADALKPKLEKLAVQQDQLNSREESQHQIFARSLGLPPDFMKPFTGQSPPLSPKILDDFKHQIDDNEKLSTADKVQAYQHALAAMSGINEHADKELKKFAAPANRQLLPMGAANARSNVNSQLLQLFGGATGSGPTILDSFAVKPAA